MIILIDDESNDNHEDKRRLLNLQSQHTITVSK